MKDNTGKDVVRNGRGQFQSTTPAFAWKDGGKSRNSVPTEAGTKHLPEESQKFNFVSQFPRHSKLSRMSLTAYELKKNRKKRTVYVTNIWNVELKGKICFMYVIGIYMKIKYDNTVTVVWKKAEKWQWVNHRFIPSHWKCTRRLEAVMRVWKVRPVADSKDFNLKRNTHSIVTRHGIWSYMLRCSERS
jgi:hypothetical protein